MKHSGRRKQFIKIDESRALPAIRIVNQIVDFFLLAAIVLTIAYGGYSFWDTERIYNEADSSRYETYKPVEKEDSPSFAELTRINSDVFAWLDVYGTKIDYPVLWADNNDKYLNMDPEGNFSLSGSLFLDKDNNKNFTDPKNIIYGHHLEKDKMFGGLDQFKKKKYFERHQYGSLYYNNENHGLVFFAFAACDAYDSNIYHIAPSGSVTEGNGNAAFLEYLKAHAENWRETGAGPEDTLVLLSTCASGESNLRYILAGVLTDQTYADPFEEEQKNSGPAVLQGLDHVLPGSPVIWGILLAVLLMTAALLLIWKYHQKYRNHIPLRDLLKELIKHEVKK